MSLARARALFAATLLVASCTPQAKDAGTAPSASASASASADDPGYATDVQTICNGPSLTEKVAPGVLTGNQMDLSQKSRLVAEVLDKLVKTKDGKALLDVAFSTPTARQRVNLLTHEATRLGIAKCEMVELWSQAP